MVMNSSVWINVVRCAAAVVCAGLLMAGGGAQSKKRDHLTEQEVDQVRENQEIDKRIEVFIKACDRRILVLTTPNTTQKKKEEEVWGPLPTGSKAELLIDYKRILEEVEEKMDDAFAHDPNAAPFKKALSKLKEAANKQIPQLRALASQMKDKKEQNALEEAIEEAETITKASTDK
ncbi:MAG: hypothetical protein M3X11_02690 [Acidobacteriota bacterium]|nr:hypothetical protein [Acidobacteriota bacterium]